MTYVIESGLIEHGNRKLRVRKVKPVSVFLVWSNQKGMWWRADRRGYTQFIDEAGRYALVEAAAIVTGATCDGLLVHKRTDPVTGREYESYDEVMVQAPEATR